MISERSFYDKESLYIAGPEVFYPNGTKLLLAMRRKAEALGFGVALPNDNVLKLDHEDPRRNADSIFANCADSINRSTAIVADLEAFRGAEPDGGTIYEIGMAYARGLRCYAYSRDMRPAAQKYAAAVLKGGVLYDLEGRVFPYPDLPYSPCIVGSSKLIEGDLDACLCALKQDIDEERKFKTRRRTPGMDLSAGVTVKKGAGPVIYLAGQDRYGDTAGPWFERMKAIYRQYGFEPYSPADDAPGVPRDYPDDPLAGAYHLFDHWQQHVRNCDVIVADLNDFHGWEPNSDAAFEAGMAWQLGKKCFGFMTDASPMIDRVPHLGEEMDYRDQGGSGVENFHYPLNLMFSSSMPILEGTMETVAARIAQACRECGLLQ